MTLRCMLRYRVRTANFHNVHPPKAHPRIQNFEGAAPLLPSLRRRLSLVSAPVPVTADATTAKQSIDSRLSPVSGFGSFSGEGSTAASMSDLVRTNHVATPRPAAVCSQNCGKKTILCPNLVDSCRNSQHRPTRLCTLHDANTWSGLCLPAEVAYPSGMLIHPVHTPVPYPRACPARTAAPSTRTGFGRGTTSCFTGDPSSNCDAKDTPTSPSPTTPEIDLSSQSNVSLDNDQPLVDASATLSQHKLDGTCTLRPLLHCGMPLNQQSHLLLAKDAQLGHYHLLLLMVLQLSILPVAAPFLQSITIPLRLQARTASPYLLLPFLRAKWLRLSCRTPTLQPPTPLSQWRPLPSPMDAEVEYNASGDDAPEEPSCPPTDMTPDSPAEEDNPEDNADVKPAGLVPSVYCAAITPTQWAALPAALRFDITLKAPLTVRIVYTWDKEAIVLQRRPWRMRRHMKRSGHVRAYAIRAEGSWQHSRTPRPSF